ncbi:helix-turn-helix domain-containing protein [Halosimplex salinum]|uniref:helix-turn-helix domain-containing protein n=1 Tax=Halosimplex salinum TaxID=1710538 RepID=UPI000F49117C|nr:helix-turn-helix domain-containing protein [Halosimplex salinum]
MTRLENVSIEELEAALDEASGKRETKRLLVAIIYKRGPSAPMIAEWLDTREQTIYRWFDRLETEPISEAVQDRQRSGRPPKLDDADRAEFREAVQNPPVEAGYDRPSWTTELAQQLLEDEFDAEYSRRHVQRLLRDADLTWQGARPQPPTADGDERTEVWKPIENE